MDELQFEEHEPKKKHLLKKILVLFFFLLLLTGALVLAAVNYYQHLLSTPADPDGAAVAFVIYPGQTVKGIAKNLADQGIISNELVFRLALKIQNKDSLIQAGNYQLSPSQTMQEVIDSFKTGKIDEQWITILEGWRIENIADYLAGKSLVDRDTFISMAYAGNFDYSFLKSQPPSSKPAGSSLEGFLFPDTYLIPEDAGTAEIIEILLNNFEKKYVADIEPALNGRSLFDIITLAAIVEREGRDLAEMQMIAGIYYNRLELGMTLGADPTVLYALGDWSTVLTADNLAIDSPYNTRINTGLPPGPICNPGLDAIKATLDPAETDYLFFLTDKDGIMRYARTNAEHNANKATYGVSGVN